MQLKVFMTLWGFNGDCLTAVEHAAAAGYDGIEGPPPTDPEHRARFALALEHHGLDYIAEICTGGDYVPRRDASVAEHLGDLANGLAAARDLNPLHATSMAGCDAWPEETSLRFFSEGMALAERFGLTLNYETHRSRILFNPWITERVVQSLPEIRLTADFSHWCVVCERLIDSELETIEAIAPNIQHIHARVGYDQGAQVPHPAAPEYREALNAHQRWWELIWRHHLQREQPVTTMTPEFGPDGYLHTLPFSGEPVADLDELNRWMMQTERDHFIRFMEQENG